MNVPARAFPRSRIRGVDISTQGITAARREAEELGLDNTEFAVVDAAEPLTRSAWRNDLTVESGIAFVTDVLGPDVRITP